MYAFGNTAISPNSITSKGSAMSFAIRMTMSFSEDDKNVINYEEAQKLFDFICKNVELPEVEKDSMDGLVQMLEKTIRGVKEE